MDQSIGLLTLQDIQPGEVNQFAGAPSEPETSFDPDSMRGELERQLADKANRFLSKALSHASDRERAGYHARLAIDWDRRMSRNRRSAANQTKIAFEGDGSVSKKIGDAHLGRGVKQGWGAQAVALIGSFIEQSLLQSQDRPYVVNGRGSREENDILPQVVSDIADLDLEESGFNEEARHLCHIAPAEAAGVLRYDFIYECKLTDKDGLTEEPGRFKPCVVSWPADNLIVSNYAEPRPEKQEAITWIAQGIAVGDLEANRRVYRVDTSDPFFPVRSAQGRYFGLEALRRKNDTEKIPTTSNRPSVIVFGAYDAEAQPSDGVSSFEKLDTHEQEGFWPMQAWVMDGSFDHELCYLFDIDPGMALPPIGQPLDAKTKRELAARLARLPLRFAWATQMNASPGSAEGNPICFERIKPVGRRNTLYLFPFRRVGRQFWPLSVADLTWNLEAAADKLRNEQLRLCELAQDPPVAFNMAGLDTPHVDEIKRLFRGGQFVGVNFGAKIQDLIQRMEFQPYDVIEQIIQVLKQEHEILSGASAIAKGTAGSKTLGQDQIALAQSQNQLTDVVFGFFLEMRRLILDMQKDRLAIEGEEGYISRAIQASGRTAAKLREILPSISGLENEVKIDAAIALGKDKAVMAQYMQAWFPLLMTAAPTLPKVGQYVSMAFGLAGIPQVATVLNDTYEPLEPAEEHDQIEDGANWITPNPKEDAIKHEAEHDIRLAELQLQLQEAAGDPQKSQEITRALMILSAHQELTRPLAMQQKIAMAMQQMAAPGGIAPPGAPQGLPSPGGPGDEQAQSRAISAQAAGVAGRDMTSEGGPLL